MLPRPLEQQSRPRLTAVTAIAIVVAASEEVVQRHSCPYGGVDGFEHLGAEQAPRNVRLVGHANELESCRLQFREGGRGVRSDLQLVEAARGTLHPLAKDDSVQDAIPIEENRAFYRRDSQRVATALSFGCDTSRCQIIG